MAGPGKRRKGTTRAPGKARTPEERAASARRGWETRNRPENLYRELVAGAKKYRQTSQRKDYSRYRAVKRRAYKVLGASEDDRETPEYKRAFAMCQRACLEADWESGPAMKFAKLS